MCWANKAQHAKQAGCVLDKNYNSNATPAPKAPTQTRLQVVIK